MKLLLSSFLALLVGAEISNNRLSRNERLASGDSFEEKLKEGYKLLKGEENADDTMRLLERLHSMEEKLKDDLILAQEKDPKLLDAADDYLEIENDHIQPIGDTIQEVNHNTGVDSALFQGDMILTKEQAEEIIDDIKENESNRNKRQAYRDKWYPTTLWSKGVYYSFYPNATEAARRVFRKAVDLWQRETCIKFRESDTAPDRISVFTGDGCWSHVGRIGGEQHLSLDDGCDSVGTAAHELGHALGFFHTHSRHDRDSFITLEVKNFKRGWLSQFTKQSKNSNYNYNLTYDYGSVMHYGATIVSKNSKPVMVPRDGKYLQALGSDIISFYDKLMMNLHYGCLDKCKAKRSTKCQNGGFPNPRSCSRCICPSGYGGRLCNERPTGCGETLTATTSFQTLTDKVGEKRRDPTDDFTMCNYWIQGPSGSKIEIVLDSFTRGMSADGCVYAGVEIKTGNDKRHTGYRFCSPSYAGTKLLSAHNVVPVITYSRYREATTVLRYRIVPSVPEIPKPSSPEMSNNRCKDTRACASLLKWDVCHSPKYDDKIRKQACAKSCGFCK